MAKQSIEWHQAVGISQQQDKDVTEKQQEYLTEFLESNCDVFSSRDWQFYAGETGKSIQWLRENATYSDDAGEYGTMLTNAFIDNDVDLMEFFI